MLGELITRSLVLILGYAYPALECFKTVEKNRVGIEELRFWCQYWIIVAILTVLERIGDTFVSWVPMYGEMKLAVFIYLWYPKTKGTGYIYETFLQPYMTKHETDIERSLLELRARAWDLAIYYWQNCTELGQTKFFEIFQYLASKPTKNSGTNSEKVENQNFTGLPPPLPNTPLSFFRGTTRQDQESYPQSPKSNVGLVYPKGQTQYIYHEDISRFGSTNNSRNNNNSHSSRFRFWRSKGDN
ncbi:hypothetical protein LguiB_003928 [Lonicera macranthoides]